MVNRIAKVVQRVIQRAFDLWGVFAISNMIVPGGRSTKAFPVHNTKLTTRSGRLLRSITGARGLNWQGTESSRTIKALGGIVTGTFIDEVPYAARWEYEGNRGYARKAIDDVEEELPRLLREETAKEFILG
jgi:hypothetical protein